VENIQEETLLSKLARTVKMVLRLPIRPRLAAVAAEAATAEKPVIFSAKYKNILKYPYDTTYIEKVEWVNANSRDSVDIKFSVGSLTQIEYIHFGFENSDDALYFKIKFPLCQ
jgi:hypothetical protein